MPAIPWQLTARQPAATTAAAATDLLGAAAVLRPAVPSMPATVPPTVPAAITAADVVFRTLTLHLSATISLAS
eukprot:COSAG04_NODE_17848_length_457_cov_1.016760_1_plen_73_part_00